MSLLRGQQVLVCLLTFCSSSLWLCTLSFGQESQVIARVNGREITAARLAFYQQSAGLSADQKERALSELTDRILIQQFLESRRISAPAAELETQRKLVETLLSEDPSPEQTLADLGLSRQQLLQELALPLAWNRYIQQVVTEKQIEEYFASHHTELDGTKRKVSQIFLKRPQDATAVEIKQKLQMLKDLRSRIQSGEMTFAQAAEQYSESPSARKGGQIGTFTFARQMPVEISKPAFATPVGQMSEPFESPFGLHLLFVEEEIPGQFSLEDVRREILAQISQQLWDQTVASLRKSAKIVQPASAK